MKQQSNKFIPAIELTPGERVRRVIAREGITAAAFARALNNYSRASLSQILQGKRPVPVSLMRMIAETYDVRYNWLLTGEGNMSVSGSREYGTPHKPIRTKPHIVQYAAAGTLTEAIEAECEQRPEVTFMPRYDFTIEVKGDSMVPAFNSGDVLACRDVTRDSYIQWGKPHVMSTTQGIIVKRPYDDGENIRCKSDNPMFADFCIPRAEIYSIALVLGVVRLT